MSYTNSLIITENFSLYFSVQTVFGLISYFPGHVTCTLPPYSAPIFAIFCEQIVFTLTLYRWYQFNR